MNEINMDEVNMDEVNMDEVNMDEVNMDEVNMESFGKNSERCLHAFLSILIIYVNPYPPEQPR